MEKMYVICFYWEGDRWKSDLKEGGKLEPNYQKHLNRVGQVDPGMPSKYVNELFKGVTKYADRPFEFICFTNEKLKVNKGIELRPFPMHTEKGVLPRVYMFSEKAGLRDRQVLCLDLDVVIMGDLKPLMEYQGQFCARSKFKRGQEYKLDGDIMSFRAGKETEDIFWKPFIKDVNAAEELTQGRERYWMRHVAGQTADRWDKVAPGKVVSFKWHVQSRHGLKPKNASILTCHGFPRPHQISIPWVKKLWG